MSAAKDVWHKLAGAPWARRYARFLPHAVLAIALLAAACTVRSYGLTTNEAVRAQSGEDAWRFVATWDRRFLPSGWLANLGLAYDMLGAAVAHAFTAMGGRDAFLPRHLLNLVAGATTVLGTYHLGRKLWSPRVAVMAAALLVLTPRFYGSSFNNPKDVPFAAAFVWAVYGVVRLLQSPTTRNAVLCGALAAVCTSVRPLGFLFVPLGAAACLWPAARGTGSRRKLVLVELGVAAVLVFALWPVLWANPPWHVVQAALAVDNPMPGHEALFLGEVHAADKQPGSYVAVWLAVTLPLPTLAASLGGATLAVRSLRGVARRTQLWSAALAGMWVVAPIGLPFVHRVAMYHGVRHFLFVMPAVALLAGLGWDGLVSFVAARWHRAGLAGLGAVALLAYGDVVATEVRLHPYEDLYFSRLVGGTRGAAPSFEVAYYGEPYGEAFHWLADHAAPHDGPIHVAAMGGPYSLMAYAHYAKDLGMDLNGSVLDYYVSDVRLKREEALPGQVVHTIEREGVPLAVVVKLAPMTMAEQGWTGPPWAEVHEASGRFAVEQGDTLVVALDSPTEQTVPLLLGYEGEIRVAVNPVHQVITGSNVAVPAFPGNGRMDMQLKAGHNAVLIDLKGLVRPAGLSVHYESDRGLTPGALPPMGRRPHHP